MARVERWRTESRNDGGQRGEEIRTQRNRGIEPRKKKETPREAGGGGYLHVVYGIMYSSKNKIYFGSECFWTLET